ncbi:hypothetical protein [Aurantiacibacter gilvus]|uniref:Uncharacterized protein n=1 Tax=Aurantiacibacter gilvus TaxID=3139141 RepID=A0ABU9IGM9_9SPHN
MQEVAANLDNWDGQTVTVEAWLFQCSELNCHLVPTRADMELLSAGCPSETCEDAILAFDERAVSLGYSPAFDQVAATLTGRHVLVTGQVNAAAWRNPGLDRSAAIQPSSIEALPE